MASYGGEDNRTEPDMLLAARTARSLGVQHLTRVAPYLAYMRQGIAVHPGEAVIQQVLGGFLAGLFDAVITVAPHLHRIDRLEQAIPVPHAVVHIESASLNLKYPFGLSLSKPCAALRQAQRERFK